MDAGTYNAVGETRDAFTVAWVTDWWRKVLCLCKRCRDVGSGKWPPAPELFAGSVVVNVVDD